jgi:ribosomal protein S6--L-glutamate ligase
VRIAILSRSKRFFSTRRIVEEAKKRKHEPLVLDPLRCIIFNSQDHSKIFYNGKELDHVDVVIPRIGILGIWHSLAVVNQFEIMGVPTLNRSYSIMLAKNKLHCLQVLVQSGINIPKTIISRYPKHLNKVVKLVDGPPVIMKMLQGTHGTGVILSESKKSIESILETIWSLGQDILIQSFIKEAKGCDIRAFVIGSQVIAAMKRIARKDDFRSNIARGAKGINFEMPQHYKNIAVQAAMAVGLEIAGVDFVEDKDGPKVIEVNSSPGFRGLEKATGKNIAACIVEYAVEFCKQKNAK